MLPARLLLLGLLAPAALMAVGVAGSGRQEALDEANAALDAPEAHWQKWLAKHGVNYETQEEHDTRFANWLASMKRIVEHNSDEQHTYWLRPSRHSDKATGEVPPRPSSREARQRMEGRGLIVETFPYADTTPPSSVNWVEEGAITEVKNEDYCSACWAYSTVDCVEALHKIMTGTLVDLSEQELIDCDIGRDGERTGCNMGYMSDAFEYMATEGIATEEDYPYFFWDGLWGERAHKCEEDRRAGDHRVKIADYHFLPQADEHALAQAVSHQPVTVEITYDLYSFYNYGGGVYNESDCDNSEIGHAVLVVGYGTDPDDGDYWLLKNSWGAHWGEDGYMRMARGVSADGAVGMSEGMCGLTHCPIMPVGLKQSAVGSDSDSDSDSGDNSDEEKVAEN